MNFSRPFKGRPLNPIPSSSTGQSDPNTSNTPNRPSMAYSASTPAPPILTRPRAGASIINGQAPGPQILAGQAGSGTGADAPGAADSITLGQLKANAPPVPVVKPKTQAFDYRYEDTDTIMHELDEFYPYVEMTQIAQNPERFKGSFEGDWLTASTKRRKAYMEVQLELLESPISEKRRAAQGRLLYLLQGCFAETSTPEMQLSWIKENAKILRSVDGVASLVLGLRDAAKRYNTASDAPEKVGASHNNSNINSVDPYDDHSAELMDLLAMLYFVIEVCRTDETFGDELMAMTPSLPIVLFQMISALKDRLPKGYPVKKVLLLLWKTILACLGGMKEVAKARVLSRELAGLPPSDKNLTKATPMDISSFRRDTSIKYPTFAPPSSSSISVSNEKLAEGIRPLPPRTNYHSTDLPSSSTSTSTTTSTTTVKPPPPATSQPAPPTSNPLPGTPAPTPPGSPAPKKKQQFQTDQTKPYIFPFSRSTIGSPTYLVPYAIAEADKLYHRHSYISLGLYQLWEAREDCLREERGLGVGGLIGFSRLAIGEEETDEAEEEQMRREWKFEEEELEAEARGDEEGVQRARERKQASRRLHRVEVIYKSTLPIMQSCVIVLLKLLLATVTGPGAGQPNMSTAASPAQEHPPPVNTAPLSREEVDIARHREITSKAVSAILILILKWFKASHILKFHYFAQLLFDSNCLLLVLKMFGLSDVSMAVQTKNEWEDHNFFRYCHLNCSKDHPPPPNSSTPPPRPQPRTLVSAFSSPPKNTQPLPPTAPGFRSTVDLLPAGQPNANEPPAITVGRPPEEEVEVLQDYSWRNFFSTINFIKILQKMTKHRTHRTYMMSQYKSPQILKRMLRIHQPMLQLQVLKLIKSQTPWCGRKWRHMNMKVITAIYLNCRPELRDEWLAGQDQDTEHEDALPQEAALRTLIQFYNKKHYPTSTSHTITAESHHRRTESTSAVTLDDPAIPSNHPPRERSTSSSEGDVFPPRRSEQASLPYNPDGMIEFWLHEYEDVLGEVFGDGEGLGDWDDLGIPPSSPRRPSYGSGIMSGHQEVNSPTSPTMPHGFSSPPPSPKAAERDDRAWNALGEIMGDGDDISDSESVVTVGELGEEARMDSAESFGRQLQLQRRRSENESTWAEMAEKTLSKMPRSPAERRRSSSSGSHSSPLRPIIPPGGRIEDIDVFDDDDDEADMRGPMPRMEGPDAEDRGDMPVDEVELVYGE